MRTGTLTLLPSPPQKITPTAPYFCMLFPSSGQDYPGVLVRCQGRKVNVMGVPCFCMFGCPAWPKNASCWPGTDRLSGFCRGCWGTPRVYRPWSGSTLYVLHQWCQQHNEQAPKKYIKMGWTFAGTNKEHAAETSPAFRPSKIEILEPPPRAAGCREADRIHI